MSELRSQLKIDYVGYDACKYACEKWHYSRCVPVGKLIKYGVWENGKYIGCVIFGRGANKDLGKPYGLSQTQCCELVRIALDKHKTHVTRIVSIVLKMLKRDFAAIKCIVSFADTEQGHEGTIYKAGNWQYTGMTKAADEYIYKGRRYHGRAFRKRFGSHLQYIDKGLNIIKGSVKHRYIMIMRCKKDNKVPALNVGGAVPTTPLQLAIREESNNA